MSVLFSIILISNLFLDKVNSHLSHAPHYVVTGIPYQPAPAQAQWPAPTNRQEPPTITPEIVPTTAQKATTDPNILNNLAIALQLLIVSNLLNSPKENGEIISSLTTALEKLPVIPQFVPETKCEQKYIVPYEPKYSVEPYSEPVPLSKYVGSFEPNIFRAYDSNAKRTSRSNVALMSPYEAITSSLETYPSVYSSPSKSVYVVDKDLFSMSDMF